MHLHAMQLGKSGATHAVDCLASKLDVGALLKTITLSALALACRA